MNQISVAIIDDEKTIRNLYEKYLEEWADKRYNLKVRKFESAEEFLFKYEDEADYQIALLDIEMKGINGVELAKKLREKKDELQIIFISGYSEYISYGYDVDALHFLVKPIQKQKLFEILDKAAQKSDDVERFIMVKHESAMRKLYLSQIVYMSSDRNYIIIYTKDEELRVRMTVKEAMAKLDDRFFQVGRSDIVNVEKIESFDHERIFMDNATEILLPRGSFESLNRKIINYY